MCQIANDLNMGGSSGPVLWQDCKDGDLNQDQFVNETEFKAYHHYRSVANETCIPRYEMYSQFAGQVTEQEILLDECKQGSNLTVCFSFNNQQCEWRPVIPENCTTFESYLAECPTDRCDVDFNVGSCRPK